MISAQDRPGYQKPEYRQGQTPPFGKKPDTWTDDPPPAPVKGFRIPPAVEKARWQKAGAITQPLVDHELALIQKHVTTPYTNAYVRDLDGALMIELPGWGTFVSETWAVAAGYVSAPAKTEEAKAARQEARKDRKEGQKAEKEAFRRKQKRVAKARQKEMLA